MSQSPPNPEQESIPPSRFILDLDQPLQLQALLEILQLLQESPQVLRKQPEARWLGQLRLRASYLLLHCSLTRSGNQCADLQLLAKHHERLARSLLRQEDRCSQFAASAMR